MLLHCCTPQSTIWQVYWPASSKVAFSTVSIDVCRSDPSLGRCLYQIFLNKAKFNPSVCVVLFQWQFSFYLAALLFATIERASKVSFFTWWPYSRWLACCPCTTWSLCCSCPEQRRTEWTDHPGEFRARFLDSAGDSGKKSRWESNLHFWREQFRRENNCTCNLSAGFCWNVKWVDSREISLRRRRWTNLFRDSRILSPSSEFPKKWKMTSDVGLR